MFLSGTVMTQVLNLHVQYTCRIGWDKIKEHCGCDRLQISFITPYKLLRFQTFEISGTLFFLVACTQLYKPLCRLVHQSVGPSVHRKLDCLEHATYGGRPCLKQQIYINTLGLPKHIFSVVFIQAHLECRYTYILWVCMNVFFQLC